MYYFLDEVTNVVSSLLSCSLKPHHYSCMHMLQYGRERMNRQMNECDDVYDKYRNLLEEVFLLVSCTCMYALSVKELHICTDGSEAAAEQPPTIISDVGGASTHPSHAEFYTTCHRNALFCLGNHHPHIQTSMPYIHECIVQLEGH